MKLLRIKSPTPIMQDIKKIYAALAAQGFVTTLQQCHDLWQDYSDTKHSKWEPLPDTQEEIHSRLIPFIEEIK